MVLPKGYGFLVLFSTQWYPGPALFLPERIPEHRNWLHGNFADHVLEEKRDSSMGGDDSEQTLLYKNF